MKIGVEKGGGKPVSRLLDQELFDNFGATKSPPSLDSRAGLLSELVGCKTTAAQQSLDGL